MTNKEENHPLTEILLKETRYKQEQQRLVEYKSKLRTHLLENCSEIFIEKYLDIILKHIESSLFMGYYIDWENLKIDLGIDGDILQSLSSVKYDILKIIWYPYIPLPEMENEVSGKQRTILFKNGYNRLEERKANVFYPFAIVDDNCLFHIPTLIPLVNYGTKKQLLSIINKLDLEQWNTCDISILPLKETKLLVNQIIKV